MKDHEMWPGGECPKCGETWRYRFVQLDGVGTRTCTVCGYFDEYKMPEMKEKREENLSWPRHDPIQILYSIRSKSDDDVGYGDYVETW
jgi:Zn ribbon nucleic-acid-binding protein